MAKYSWSETFISLEGEFLYQGYPTVYVRFARCNFKCQKFNNPDNVPITNGVLGFDPKDYTNINDLPIITMGCDSLYAHDSRFEHMWKSGNEDALALELTELLPHMSDICGYSYDMESMEQTKGFDKWVHPVTKHPYILSLTGGEPTLYQKTIPILLDHPFLNDLQLLLIETNASVPLRDEFIRYLNDWLDKDSNRKVIWSNSPKLSASGEDWNAAIRPDIIKKQLNVNNCIQYFKFVVGPRDTDFDEVRQAMQEYSTVLGNDYKIVGVMPESCTAEQQNEIAKQVAEMCIQRGYIYVSRLQNYLWGNAIGT